MEEKKLPIFMAFENAVESKSLNKETLPATNEKILNLLSKAKSKSHPGCLSVFRCSHNPKFNHSGTGASPVFYNSDDSLESFVSSSSVVIGSDDFELMAPAGAVAIPTIKLFLSKITLGEETKTFYEFLHDSRYSKEELCGELADAIKFEPLSPTSGYRMPQVYFTANNGESYTLMLPVFASSLVLKTIEKTKNLEKLFKVEGENIKKKSELSEEKKTKKVKKEKTENKISFKKPYFNQRMQVLRGGSNPQNLGRFGIEIGSRGFALCSEPPVLKPFVKDISRQKNFFTIQNLSGSGLAFAMDIAKLVRVAFSEKSSESKFFFENHVRSLAMDFVNTAISEASKDMRYENCSLPDYQKFWLAPRSFQDENGNMNEADTEKFYGWAWKKLVAKDFAFFLAGFCAKKNHGKENSVCDDIYFKKFEKIFLECM